MDGDTSIFEMETTLINLSLAGNSEGNKSKSEVTEAKKILLSKPSESVQKTRDRGEQLELENWLDDVLE